MRARVSPLLATACAAMAALSISCSGCTPGRPATPAPALSPTVAPAQTTVPTRPPTAAPPFLPASTLNKGDFYLTVDGVQSLTFSRNVIGIQPADFDRVLELVKKGGSTLVRVPFIVNYDTGITSTGAVDEAWARNMERVFDKSYAEGLYVLPTFTSWFAWNNGPGYSTWAQNPLNKANGGPAAAPHELFVKDSATQKLWLQWAKTLVERWQARPNILAWEIISEANLASGVTEREAIAFHELAASIFRAADPKHRPITSSLAGTGTWPSFYASDSIDFINVHPYPASGRLDTFLLQEVRQDLAAYQKPVMIGESGLSAEPPDVSPPTLTTAKNARLGIKHAIWAGVVSGAMNARALYWEDSFAMYFPALSWPFIEQYADAELPAASFTRGVDFAGLKPLAAQFSASIAGAALGNGDLVIGWFRDAACEPPDWSLQPVISGQKITISVPGSAASWQVEFYSTETGKALPGSATATRQGERVTVALPDFTDDIAFKMRPRPGIPLTPAAPGTTVAPTTGTIAGQWTGTIAAEDGGFSASVNLSIQPGCKPGGVCGTVSVPQVPCAGKLLLAEIDGDTFVFVEQEMAGATACVSGGREYLQLQANGTLSFRYEFTSPSGAKTRSSGILTK